MIMDETIAVAIESMPLNYVSQDVRNTEKLANERKLFFSQDVDIGIVEFVRNIMMFNIEDKGTPKEERQPIYIYIMSYGGQTDAMWSLIDMINLSETPIYTVNIGVASSAASLIFISGHKRFMLKNANVTLHEGSAHLAGDAIKVMDASESYKKELQRMKTYILEHTSIPKAQLMKKRANDWEIDSEYCIENGVCDVVVDNIYDIL